MPNYAIEKLQMFLEIWRELFKKVVNRVSLILFILLVVETTFAPLANAQMAAILDFSADCRNYEIVNDTQPAQFQQNPNWQPIPNWINLMKVNQNNQPVANGIATVFDIEANHNVVIPNGQEECNYQSNAGGVVNLCFIGRNNADINDIGAFVGRDNNAPNCQ